MTADELVRAAVDKFVAEAPDADFRKEPTLSLRGLLFKYRRAPSSEEMKTGWNLREFPAQPLPMVVAIADSNAILRYLFSDRRLKEVRLAITREGRPWSRSRIGVMY